MDKIRELAQALTDSASAKEKNKTSAYDTSAEVISIEGETAWIRVPGGVERTPAKMVVNAKQGDEVYVRIVGGKAYITGNVTSPPTDDSAAVRAETQAIRAMRAADAASEQAETAHKAADSAVKDARTANESANAAVEDAAMARTMAEQAEADAETAADAATAAQASAGQAATSASNAASSASQAASSASTAATAATQAVADASTAASSASAAQTSAVAAQSSANAAGESASRAQAAAAAAQADADTVLEQQEYFWHDSLGAHVLSDTDDVTGVRYRTDIKGAGMDIKVLNTNGTEDSVATFGETTRVGKTGESRLELDYHSMQLIDKEGSSYFYVSDLRNEQGTATIRQYYTIKGTGVYCNLLCTPIDANYHVYYYGREISVQIFPHEDMFKVTEEFSGTARIYAIYETRDEKAKRFSYGIHDAGSDQSQGILGLSGGYRTKAYGVGACALGYAELTKFSDEASGTIEAFGVGSLAIGYSEVSDETAYANIRSIGDGSIAFGIPHGGSIEAWGKGSIAGGYAGTYANGDHESASILEAKGIASMAHGLGQVRAIGIASHALGRDVVSNYDYQTVIGKYNNNQTDTAFEIGNGTSDSARSNALEVTWDGDIKFQLNTTDALYTALSNMGWL